MKKTIFFIITCVLIWDFISTQSTVIPLFIPINEGIPDNELSRLSLEVLPIISHKFKIQIFSDRIRIDSRPKCYKSQGFDGKDTVKGCEIGVYICDNDFHKQCLWVHKSHCQCSSPDEFFKLKECRISITKVPTGDPKYPYINIPIGECKLAVWIVALLTTFSALFVGYLIKLLLNTIYKKN
ncbi:putative integral membrane protein [Cryptosporidium hominis]|uniref:Uncharacterized protein n=1 Tax=Cryptosporidium hominis TaxID=237895 RepID=A0ABX5BD02_CRYHO|nr:hypothetical protein ChTU502y2012_407g1060 [Cryptosporidium hominis]PPA64156.1 putative integral membrane protein [Cryptosporidium hominis]PPS94805.1 Uncharacterized protein GY17_00002007 [Cryptosporidium hominis]|eukprot:PPS94805.1 Uncharacterized protein GY17_00002007 [Cryptosporidium hominis]